MTKSFGEKIVQKTPLLMNKTKGQHFLVNPEVIKMIAERSGIKATDIILEIGPGNGNLTSLLLQQGKQVTAIEVDPWMISELLKRFSPYSPLGSKLSLIKGDAIKTEWPFFDLCVANLPYQISSPVIFKLLAHRPLFRCAVVMVQKEFADRIVAQPNTENYCRLSVNVQLMASVAFLFKVGPKNFKPPPKVDSAVIRIEPKNPQPQIDFEQWDSLLRICFLRKNKTLRALFVSKGVLNELARINKQEAQLTQQNTKQILQRKKHQENNISDMECESDEEEVKVKRIKKIKKQKVQKTEKNEFKSKVEKVLVDLKFDKMRSLKLHWTQFVELLNAFNKSGIYFK